MDDPTPCSAVVHGIGTCPGIIKSEPMKRDGKCQVCKVVENARKKSWWEKMLIKHRGYC